MSIFTSLWCLANRHDPVRRDVRWDGHAYVGDCRRCGTPIQRHGHRDWRKRKLAAGHLPTSN